MYSVFKSPTLIDRKNIQSENNVTARKPGQLSNRKPFGERSNINNIENCTPLAKTQSVNKPSQDFGLDLSEHVCSYKEIKDTFNDLCDESMFLGKKGLKNIYSSFLNEKEENFADFDLIFDLKPIKIDRNDENFNYDAEKICKMFSNEYELIYDDIPLPELDLDF